MMKNNANGKPSAKILDLKAIKAALQENWPAAIEANSSLLELEPKNLKAKMRLGRAYLQSRKFKDAEKLFKEVLKTDPINAVAKRNLELARARKTEKNGVTVDFKKLIKEPGMAEDVGFQLSGKLTADNFTKGEELSFRVTRSGVVIMRNSKAIGKIETGLAQRLKNAKKKKANVTVEFLKGRERNVVAIFRSDIPVLKAEKQDVKPYLKKGSIEEPELELPDEEEE